MSTTTSPGRTPARSASRESRRAVPVSSRAATSASDSACSASSASSACRAARSVRRIAACSWAQRCRSDDSTVARASSGVPVRTRLRAIAGVTRNADRIAARCPPTSAPTRWKGTCGDHGTTTCPATSMPRRPALPASWANSPASSSSPLARSTRSITTVRAGRLTPSASVSVAKATFRSPSANAASTTSRWTGASPPWWAATPDSSASCQPAASIARSSPPDKGASDSLTRARIRTRSPRW